MSNQELYNKYDLLLPSKFDGGFLIVAIDEKIKAGYLDGYFTSKEIDEILTEISARFQLDAVRQWARIKDNLLHYFIRNHPDEPGKYYLTDYAVSVIELMRNKLENPYKKHPLKKSFESSFFLRFNEITAIEDLERKFGRLFISGAKKIITDHLDGLEDELRECYKTLNELLNNDEENASGMVRKFALVFRGFGERAEDITGAMRTKDKFLKDLQMVVDNFYENIDNVKFSDNDAAKSKAINDWERSREIYNDIKDFFNTVDNKISVIRRQIINASEKLSELQEYFSTRASYRLQIQKLLRLVLQTAQYSEDGVVFETNFPLKQLVYEQDKILYLRHYEFESKKPNTIIAILPDAEYEQEERNKIEKEINRQQIINEWVKKAKQQLALQQQLLLDELMNEILANEKDLSIAYGVAAEMIAFTSENPDIHIVIEQKLITLQQKDFALWKTRIWK